MKMNIKTNNNGIALILVLGILAVLAVLATTFAFNMRLEQKAARNYLDAVTADCIARLGIEHAIALLHNDLSGSTAAYDWNGDTWGYLDDGDTTFGAYDGTHHKNLDDYEHTCTPGYSGTDAQWKGIWQDGVLTGRYAVLVLDESGKMNINAAGNATNPHVSNEGWTVSEMDLGELPDITASIAVDIVKQRYGSDDDPGDTGDDDEADEDILMHDGIDNDGDSLIDSDDTDEGDDEPDEFTPWYPRGDDEPFSTITQIRLVPTITSTIWDNVKNLITVNSRTRNQYWDGSSWKPKLNLNAVADVSELSALFNDAGVSDYDQKACNIIDYRDENYIISSIHNAGWIYGVEPILINEVLARSHLVDDTNQGPWDGGGDHTVTYSGFAPNTCYRLRITSNAASINNFTIKVGTDLIGEPITASGGTLDYASSTTSNLQYCISSVAGNIDVTVVDPDPPDGSWSGIDKINFTCAEFVELCNISDTAIDLVTAPAWTIAIGSGSDVAIPAGAKFGSASYNDIDPGSYFVLTNDPDLFAYSYGDWSGTWGNVAAENVPVADMSGSWTNGYATDGELNDSGEPGGGAEEDIVIKNPDGLLAERAVNADLYSTNYGSSGHIGESREKDDPTVRNDWGNNTNNRASPDSATNSRVSGHTLDEIYIQNGPFANIGEISNDSNVAPNFYKGVRSGSAWTAISGDDEPDDLGLIAERITVDAVRLDAETADVADTGGANEWSNAAAGPYLTKSCVALDGGDRTSYWEWQEARLQPVPHILYIYGLYTNDTDTGYLDVYVADYDGTAYSFPGLPVAGGNDVEFKPSDGLKIVGTIGTGKIGSDGRFAIQLVMDDSKTSKDVHFDYLLLVPESVPGKVNVNTAALQVLKALPGLSAAAAEAIYNNVHSSSPEVPYEKLGDVLDATGIDAAQFSTISNLISVHSDVFKIICLAQTIQDLSTSHAVDDFDLEVLAEKKVEVIVDRSALPSGPIRILSWKEITE